MSNTSPDETSLVQRIPGRVYLVGGAVRDRLLGLPVRERDWVVVGATAQSLLDLGFRRVGRGFPVFLHPQTGEEYALARQERKTGAGYRGFSVDASATITLEQDLRRRDLTINAIAETLDGEIIDPYGGRDDLRAGLLRHVSSAFREDPVRVLRTARFAARLSTHGFRIADKTLSLLKEIAHDGELDALVPERVWQELVSALATPRPSQFFAVLSDVCALPGIFPELIACAGGNRWAVALTGLDRSAEAGNDPAVTFACLGYAADEAAVKALCQRLRAPRNYRDGAVLLAAHWQQLQDASGAAAAFALIESLDALRRPSRLSSLLAAATALEPAVHARAGPLQDALNAARRVTTAQLRSAGLRGMELAEALRGARRDAFAASWGAAR